MTERDRETDRETDTERDRDGTEFIGPKPPVGVGPKSEKSEIMKREKDRDETAFIGPDPVGVGPNRPFLAKNWPK